MNQESRKFIFKRRDCEAINRALCKAYDWVTQGPWRNPFLQKYCARAEEDILGIMMKCHYDYYAPGKTNIRQKFPIVVELECDEYNNLKDLLEDSDDINEDLTRNKICNMLRKPEKYYRILENYKEVV